jgi:hypothetical protein
LANFDGFVVDDIGGRFGNDVRVFFTPDKTKFEFNASVDSEKAKASKTDLINFIVGKVSEEKANQLLQTGVLTGGELD